MVIKDFITISNDKKNSFTADTAKESINGFLARFKSRKFSIKEYHDGSFHALIDKNGITYSQLYKKFESRAEAKKFAESLVTEGTLFEVHQDTFCEGWVNTWTFEDDEGNQLPEQYKSKAEAQKEIDAFLQEIADDIASGERDADSGYSAEEFRIYDVTNQEYV